MNDMLSDVFLRGTYRGRIAPTPTGYLHLGHARTFWIAQARAREHNGVLVFRNEDLDPDRCKPQYVEAMYSDLRWFGLEWQEGPDVGGPYGPYVQSQRREYYLAAWTRLVESGAVYPCICSRKDLERSAHAPHDADEDDEPLYPGTCRNARASEEQKHDPRGVNWRFRVPDGETITFHDNNPVIGLRSYVCGRDFGDFLVWRRDDVPSYQLAVVVDDAAMSISEVVRGEDLLKSTARQLLLQRALGLPTPEYFHCALMRDEKGVRLAKRHDALSLNTLREQGAMPGSLRADW